MENASGAYRFKSDRKPLIDDETYASWYEESINDPEKFWGLQAAAHLDWYTKWHTVQSGSPHTEDVSWFEGGKLNVSYNCLDRHVLAGHGDQKALIYEGNEGEVRIITYGEMLEAVSRLANVLHERGVKKGDRVCIYMPMIPEATFAMLACSRIGAVHSVVFGGFSSEALASRILDADCKTIITADIGRRGDKVIPLKERVNEALRQCPLVETTLMVRTSDVAVEAHPTDVDYHTEVAKAAAHCEPEKMDAESPLFILYTSGSTGKPKGVVHTTGGYLLYVAMTHRYAFDYHDGDVYWCMADIGWVTGHSYVVYGPLCNRATSVMFEGVPTYPDASRTWEIVEKHSVNILYSTPTIIRSLMMYGNEFVRHDRSSLRVLGSVGEPINPEAWRWFHQVIGEERCPIVDTWWQTETGGFALLPLPWAGTQKPGYCMRPFFGVQPAILDEEGHEIAGEGSGKLVLKGLWPGMMRTLWENHERYLKTYFEVHPGYYLTGDGAERDQDGDLRVTGRVDDALNVSGHLIGTAEIESALTAHTSIAESAVIGRPHDIKGESAFAFVVLKQGKEFTPSLEAELMDAVKERIGAFAKPDTIVSVPGLPKTRSGKIMRRILRKIALHQNDELGDISTLADPDIIPHLVKSVMSV